MFVSSRSEIWATSTKHLHLAGGFWRFELIYRWNLRQDETDRSWLLWLGHGDDNDYNFHDGNDNNNEDDNDVDDNDGDEDDDDDDDDDDNDGDSECNPNDPILWLWTVWWKKLDMMHLMDMMDIEIDMNK